MASPKPMKIKTRVALEHALKELMGPPKRMNETQEKHWLRCRAALDADRMPDAADLGYIEFAYNSNIVRAYLPGP
jgi:hypothetical protein